MSDLRDRVNAEAQDAYRATLNYQLAHNGLRSSLLEEVYFVAERMQRAVEEYERLLGLAHDAFEDAWEATITTGEYQAGPLADPGDHFVGMPR